uniref:Uncharacterized protein n=1 Tax=Scleropages formosus TaxID=113540 RepID=A0A8C9TJG2_SCLFO
MAPSSIHQWNTHTLCHSHTMGEPEQHVNDASCYVTGGMKEKVGIAAVHIKLMATRGGMGATEFRELVARFSISHSF